MNENNGMNHRQRFEAMGNNVEIKMAHILINMDNYRSKVEVKPEWRLVLDTYLENIKVIWETFNTDCVGEYPTQTQYDVFKSAQKEIAAFVFVSNLYDNIERYNKNKLATEMGFTLSDTDRAKLEKKSGRPDGWGAAFMDYRIELLPPSPKKYADSPKSHWNKQLRNNFQRAAAIWDTFSGDIHIGRSLNDVQWEVYLKTQNEINAARFIDNILGNVQRSLAGSKA